VSGIRDVKTAKEAWPWAAKSYRRGNGKRHRCHRAQPLGEASGESQGSRVQESNGIFSSAGQGREQESSTTGCSNGGILGNQIESTRRLIAIEERAIAAHTAALRELQQQLQQLEALADEAESAETEEET
jgi:hypothetical protein